MQGKKIRFSVLGGRSRTGVVKNGGGSRTLGDVAPMIAKRLGLLGSFECLDKRHEHQVLDPRMKLRDLPTNDIELVSEHTPARPVWR